MIPWFIVHCIRWFCRFFGLRVFTVSTIGGWGVSSMRFRRCGPVDPKLEASLTELALGQAELLGTPSGWARGKRRPAIG